MGWPTSSFQVFANACKNQSTRSKLDRVRYVAIVVHDPDDQVFINCVNDNYAKLNHETGEDFAYITFCGMPRDYNPLHPEPDSIPPTDNDPDLIRLIQRQFNIRKLPSLIITDNLSSNRYFTWASSTEEIFNQLIVLGRFSSEGMLDPRDLEYYCRIHTHRHRPGTIPWNDELDSNSELHWMQTPDGRTIAEIMAESLAVYEIDEREWRYDRENARFLLNERLKSIQERIEDVSEQSDESIQQIEHLLLLLSNISNRLSHSKIGPYRLNEERFNECIDLVKEEVKNYNNIAKLFAFADHKIFRGFSLDDFRPLGAALGNIYEAEVNATIIQAARWLKGIPMPDYFCKHYEALQNRACMVGNVDLNFYDRAHDILRMISLGQVEHVINGIENLRDDLPENMAERIKEFSFLRNEACHPGPGMPREEFDKMYNLFCHDMHYFLPTLNDMQARLQGRSI